MINVLDVGCRYGIYPLFKSNINTLNYIGVDADLEEIKRLKKKYKKYKNIKFYSHFLSDKRAEVNFNLSKHRGYNSSKKINPESLWFNFVRKNEKAVDKVIKLSSIKSGEWINEKIKGKIILKLDIEGGELDFLNGLSDENFENIEAVITESHFSNPFISNSNFATIFQKLSENQFWLCDLSLEKIKISEYSENQDLVPHSATSIFLKKKYLVNDVIARDHLVSSQILFYLKKFSLLIGLCKKIGYSKLKKNPLFKKIKYEIGHKFNRIEKNQFSLRKINKEFKKIFNDNMLFQSNFNESIFFNPD
jgi:FkbM family methyltransferase